MALQIDSPWRIRPSPQGFVNADVIHMQLRTQYGTLWNPPLIPFVSRLRRGSVLLLRYALCSPSCIPKWLSAAHFLVADLCIASRHEHPLSNLEMRLCSLA